MVKFYLFKSVSDAHCCCIQKLYVIASKRPSLYVRIYKPSKSGMEEEVKLKIIEMPGELFDFFSRSDI